MSAVFPTCEIGADPKLIVRWARGVERLGFGALVTFDHVLGGCARRA
jgi:hypothetical protein